MAQNQAELQVLQGNSQFTTEFYKVLSKKEGNIFFSPIIIHAGLSMAYQGADGTTAQALAKTLHVPESKAAGDGYLQIMKRLNSVKSVTLLMANKIFLMKGHTMLEAFGNAVTKSFLSEVQQVDFVQNQAAAKTINTWVEKQTRKKIKDLIKANDLNALTRLVLVNAIYFKGNWKHKFDKNYTKTEPFYLNRVRKVDVQMMHITKSFRYKNDEDLDAQLVELPYTNEHLSMIIILPNQKNGIKALEKELTTVNLTDLTTDMRKTRVNVALPKFKIEETIDLEDSLTKLGLGDIFDPKKANFQGMLEGDEDVLYVTKAIQKAFIEVNEEGAEAAAATGRLCGGGPPPSPPPEFIADHPFIYMLFEERGGLLFVGRLSKPDA